MLPALDRHSAYAAVEQDLGSIFKFRAQGFFADRRSSARYFPSNYGGVVVPSTNPFYVDPLGTGQPITVHYVITTDRRSYHIALTSVMKTAMAALSWTYPQDALIALRWASSAAEAAAPVAAGIEVEQLHFNYSVSGDRPAWRPFRAFDDGRQTFIEFPATLAVGEAPPIFLLDGKGEAQLVNYRVKGRFYVVDRIFDVAELRLGTKHQQIVRISRVAEGAPKRRGS